MNDADPSYTCSRCGAVYNRERFLDAHPGPFAEDAWNALAQSTMVECRSCEPTVMQQSRPS